MLNIFSTSARAVHGWVNFERLRSGVAVLELNCSSRSLVHQGNDRKSGMACLVQRSVFVFVWQDALLVRGSVILLEHVNRLWVHDCCSNEP
jgi:hypothetical protein